MGKNNNDILTKAINISDGTTRVLGVAVGAIGVILFIASAIYEAYFKAVPVDPTEAVVTNDTKGLIMLFAAYALVLMGIAIYTSSMTGLDMRMKTINFSSFYLFCLFVPFAIIFLLVTITTKVSASLGPILFLCWLIQGICMASGSSLSSDTSTIFPKLIS